MSPTAAAVYTPFVIDLSHTVRAGMVTYPGLPGPVVCDFLTREASREHYEPGTEFHIGKIEMVANTGTYVDAPFHRYPDGDDLAALPLTSLANLETVLVEACGQRVDADAFSGLHVRGKAVLVRTDWSKHWGTDKYLSGHPFLTEDAAVLLRESGAALVGIDSLNIDDTSGGTRPVHSALLGAGIPVCEHLTNLSALPAGPLRFFAVPVKVEGMGTFPVRAFCCLGPTSPDVAP